MMKFLLLSLLVAHAQAAPKPFLCTIMKTVNGVPVDALNHPQTGELIEPYSKTSVVTTGTSATGHALFGAYGEIIGEITTTLDTVCKLTLTESTTWVSTTVTAPAGIRVTPDANLTLKSGVTYTASCMLNEPFPELKPTHP